VIRRATFGDLPDLLDMAQRFLQESNLPLTYSEEQAYKVYYEGLSHGILLVDEDDGVIAGAIMGYMDRDFTIEYCAYITKFFVEKEFRGLDVSMGLIKAFEAEVSEAVIIYTSATAGMGDRIEKMYVRLFEKAGYNVLGRILMRSL